MHPRGIGIDLIEIDRIRKVIAKYPERFIKKIYTPAEYDYCHKYRDPMPSLAGRFAAKEAAVKALGVGFGKDICWQDFEVIRSEKGQPGLHVSDKIKQLFPDIEFLLSISHCRFYATAIAWTFSNSRYAKFD